MPENEPMPDLHIFSPIFKDRGCAESIFAPSGMSRDNSLKKSYCTDQRRQSARWQVFRDSNSRYMLDVKTKSPEPEAADATINEDL